MRIKSLLAGPLAALLALFLAACGAGAGTSPAVAPTDAPAASGATAMPESMPGMDHSSMPGMSDAPYDATFIDGMILHHEGAIVMANQALEQTERPEIKELANAIITAQEAEIAQLREWRTVWYPDLAETAGMGMDMGTMEVPAGDAPFDQRFAQAMIPHHEAAVLMARDALQSAERQEIKDLAQAIITAQEGETALLRQWLQEWYGITE